MTTTPIAERDAGRPPFHPTSPLFWLNDDGAAYTGTLEQALAAPPSPRPLLLGTNHDEGTLFVSSIFAKPVTDEPDPQAALAVRLQREQRRGHRRARSDRELRVGERRPRRRDHDALFVCPARRTARAVVAGARRRFARVPEGARESVAAERGRHPLGGDPFASGNDNYLLTRRQLGRAARGRDAG